MTLKINCNLSLILILSNGKNSYNDNFSQCKNAKDKIIWSKICIFHVYKNFIFNLSPFFEKIIIFYDKSVIQDVFPIKNRFLQNNLFSNQVYKKYIRKDNSFYMHSYTTYMVIISNFLWSLFYFEYLSTFTRTIIAQKLFIIFL